jgi:uncharacterized 2Fe-2S/4Fe-4S cluster protein (DUF4445 family)
LEKHSVRVTFQPDAREIWVVAGSTVKEALFAASIPLSLPCGGRGRCGRCVVLVKGKVSGIADDEKKKLPRHLKGARLACLARIEGDVTVTVPASSRVAVQKIAAKGARSGIYPFKPVVTKVFLGKPQAGPRRRLQQVYGIGPEDITLGITDLALADDALRADRGWRLGLHTDATVVAAANEIIGFEAGDTASACYGAAIDVGTNTVVCSLVDLATGRELANASAINPQVMHGDDVISRIRFSKSAGGLEMLRTEIVRLINGLIEAVSRKIGIDRGRIYAVSAVGNTAMQHILMGISPADLGRAPYRPTAVSPVEAAACRVGITAHPDCRLLLPPVIGGFVGGDLVALVVSQSLHKRKRPVLAADLGTNGEIVVAGKGIIAACSTAAGPAFEGERISAGVRAIRGAIEDVRIVGGRVGVVTIGRARPLGICGSGLLAAIGELVRARVIEPSGRIAARREVKQRSLAMRITEGDRGREFVFSKRPPVTLRQGDVREVQLGKAAMCAGIRVLLGTVGIAPQEISEVLIAGGFGSALRPSSIRSVGLVPPGVGARLRVIGNSAIEGAKIFLASEAARVEAREIAARTEHVELFSRPEFKEEFYAGMGFPSP